MNKIQKGNLLIAKFLGLKITQPKGYTLNKDGSEDCFMSFTKQYDFLQMESRRESEIHRYLKFHESWDWLMTTCKKWDDLNFNRSSLEKQYVNLCNELDNSVTLYDMNVVLYQLVENIIWYNKNVLEISLSQLKF